jgi:hypothetical protein
MGKALLVNIDLDLGHEVLQALDSSGLRVNVALWAYLPDYEDWRLVLASRKLEAAGLQQGYVAIRKALETAGINFDRSPEIMIMRSTNPFVRDLRRLFGKAKNVEGMRLGGQMIGDRYLEDAYVYRIS